jgi:hypothetical protein
LVFSPPSKYKKHIFRTSLIPFLAYLEFQTLELFYEGQDLTDPTLIFLEKVLDKSKNHVDPTLGVGFILTVR